jgi:hypothetical protein
MDQLPVDNEDLENYPATGMPWEFEGMEVAEQNYLDYTARGFRGPNRHFKDGIEVPAPLEQRDYRSNPYG